MKFILTFCCLLFVGVLCIRADSVTVEGTRGPTWGDITGDHAFVQRITKQRIPFIRREETVQHPELETGHAIVVSSLRGIKHVNLVDTAKTECGNPTVELKEGGPPNALAVIHITTERGCPLDSVLTFYTNKK